MSRTTLAQKIENLRIKYRGLPYMEAGELRLEGFRPENIARLVDEGVLARIKHGIYRFADEDDLDDEELIAALYPDGVICMYSALFHYGYSDRSPHAWDVAIDRNASKARFNIDYPPIEPHFMDSRHLAYGVVKDDFNGTQLNVFDRDRLICEVVRNERKMDAELFRKAVQGYVQDPERCIPHLIEYAERRGMTKRVEERIGIWLV